MRKLAFVGALGLSMVTGAGVASAQDYSYGGDQLGGCVFDIAASLGNVYAIGCDGLLYRRLTSGWQQFSPTTEAVQVEVSGAGVPWIRKSNGKIYRWDGSTFVRIGPNSNCASDFGVGWENGVWELGCNGTTKRVYQWNGSSWVEPEPTARASHIAVGLDNLPWLQVDVGSGDAWRWNGSSFQFIDSCVSVVGGGGWVVGCVEGGGGDDIWKWDSSLGWLFGGVLGDDVIGLSNDGTFGRLADNASINQSKFDTFTMDTTQTTVLSVQVGAKYFDPGVTTLYWENSTNGQFVTLRQVNGPNAAGVINADQNLSSALTCTFFRNNGMRKSSPPQKMWLGGANDRWASITNHALRDVCLSSLPI